jgi:predicted transcriptional regulator
VRLPDAVWDELQRIAEARGASAHALMREAIVRWVLDAREPARAKPRKRARKVA